MVLPLLPFRAAFVNPLKPEGPEEEKIFQEGEGEDTVCVGEGGDPTCVRQRAGTPRARWIGRGVLQLYSVFLLP